MAQRSLKGDVKVEFTEAASRQGIDSGESVKTLFGKIRKWLSDLKPVAFSGSYNDLTNKPTIPPAVAVKGNAESEYRTGNVNLTPANLGLGNVDNTSDANKPISTATQAEFDKQQAQIDKALEQTGYNLLEITADTQTINGVTFIVDKAAGTITANGTASQGTWANVSFGKLSAGNYILSGCPTSSFDKFSLVLYENISSNPIIVYNVGNNNMFTLPNAKNYKLQIRITAGTTLSYVVFKPMIVPAELAGVPFQPYAKSNAELTRYTDYIELIPDDTHNRNTIAIGSDKNLRISEYKDNNVRELVFGDQSGINYIRAAINTDYSELGFYSDGNYSGRIRSGGSKLHIERGLKKNVEIDGVNGTIKIGSDLNNSSGNKIAIDTNGVHIVSGGTVFEVKSDGVYINGTKIGG